MGRIAKTLIGTAGVLVVVAVGLKYAPAPQTPVQIRKQIDIARAPAEVFDFVTTPGNWPRWHPSSLAVQGATDHSLQVGEQASEDFVVAGRRGRALWTVVERDAPRRWRIEGGGQEGGRAWITYTLTATATGTHFERDMRYRMPNMLTALLDPLLTRRLIDEESATALRRLKQVLEAGGASASPQ